MGQGRTGAGQAEPVAKPADDELQLVLDSVPAFIWFKDCDNRILRVNRLAAEAMGTSTDDLVGRATGEVYPDEAQRYHEDDLEVVRSGRAKRGIVEPLTMANGEKRWVRTDKVPYRDGAGEIIGVLVFAVDITEHVRAEEALQEARSDLELRVAQRTAELAAVVEDLRQEIVVRERVEEQVREQQAELAHLLRVRTVEGMAAQLAHEINQPLAAIVNFARGLARRLRRSGVDVDAAQRVSEQISTQALRAADIVARLRDFVRKEPPRREPCDPAAIVREAALLVAPDARRCGVAIRIDLPESLPEVRADRIQIEQVVLNLLRNGLEAMDDHAGDAALLVAAAVRDDGMLEVRIRDHGRGFNADEARMLFEPYFTTKKNGLGMGLSISRSIIAAHGGEISGSANPDGGATFSFTLPLCTQAA